MNFRLTGSILLIIFSFCLGDEEATVEELKVRLDIRFVYLVINI